ncbi:hypothetical protein QQF64_020539 [Cirrhinus molitorella]|uniref:Uncharacterized protein n=1 Tax=Cirrhinus molitorella TaxID=172907 RepID=A0ABR3LCY6_9TELE
MEGQGIGWGQQPERRRRRGVRLHGGGVGRVQSNVGRTTVSSIIQTFRHRTGLQDNFTGVFTPEQEEAICTMVVENNAIRLREIKSAVIENNNIFENIQTVSISTIDRVLKKHQMNMKQLYTVPFVRNGERV